MNNDNYQFPKHERNVIKNEVKENNRDTFYAGSFEVFTV